MRERGTGGPGNRLEAAARKLVLGGALFAALGAILLLACKNPTPPEVSETPDAPRGPPPNVLLIVYDTARASDFSAGSDAGAVTPVFDQLAAEGVLYPYARTVSAWTVPSHASLFTGRYPSRHGAHHRHPRVREELSTMAELLAPTHDTAGFSENPHISREKGYGQGFAVYDETWRYWPRGEASPSTIQLALSWLELRQVLQQSQRPFFLFVNLMDAHLPYQPPEKYVPRVQPAGLSDEALRRMGTFGGYDAWSVIAGDLSLSDENALALDTLHRASVAYADDRAGQLIAQLRADGLLDDTLVILVADHGENIGDHGLMDHQFCLYETLLRVPLAMRLPGTFEGGRRVDTAVQLVDLLPTVLDVVGVDADLRPPVDGTSLVGQGPAVDRPVIAEYMRPAAAREAFVARHPSFDYDRLERGIASYQEGRHKLILSESGARELYDLSADPGELHDRSAEDPDVADDLQAKLERWTAAAQATAPAAPPTELDPETIKALRELGYVE